jgi:hypothetical protein
MSLFNHDSVTATTLGWRQLKNKVSSSIFGSSDLALIQQKLGKCDFEDFVIQALGLCMTIFFRFSMLEPQGLW